MIDTLVLVLARRKHAGGNNALDDLCSRYGVNSLRSKHGAFLDAELLAAVYVELTTTRQSALQLEPITLAPSNIQAIVRVRRQPWRPRVSVERSRSAPAVRAHARKRGDLARLYAGHHDDVGGAGGTNVSFRDLRRCACRNPIERNTIARPQADR